MRTSIETIALIFDFDDTLIPDTTTQLLLKYGVDTESFWLKDVKKLVLAGYDPGHAYLRLLLDKIGPKKPLGTLTNGRLREFGAHIERGFYPGVKALLQDLRRIVEQYRNIDIEFYVISGGLQEIIEGTSLIRDNFKGVYASQLSGDTEPFLKYIKRCVTFTEKTRYLFEINKGLSPTRTRRDPYLVNKDVPMNRRRVPFSNMIYVGDGLTDIPCFSLVRAGVRGEEGGIAFGVFDPTQKRSAKQALQEYLRPGRVLSVHKPRYRKTDELGSLIRAAVGERCSKIGIKRHEVE